MSPSGTPGIVATDAPSQHCSGVALFYWPAPHFAVEAIQKFGFNVAVFQLDMEERPWNIVVCYLAPDDTLTIKSVLAAINELPRGAKLMVVGDLNTNLSEPEGDRRVEEILATLATDGIHDMSGHFLPRWHSWLRDRRTWIIIRAGREVRSRTDYIMMMDHRLFWNESVRDPRHN